MKVVAATPLYPPRSRVGAWLATHAHLRGLARRGHRVLVVRSISRNDRYTLDGVEVVDKSVDLAGALTDADVLVCHAGDDGVAATAAGELGVPVVRLVHGLHIHPDLEGSALVVANSQATAKHLDWDGPLVVSPPPFDPADFATTPGELVTLVNLSPPKGADTFWLLAAAMPHVRFLGVRGGYGEQVFRSAPNVEVMRRATPNIRDDVYHRTRVLLMPSEYETWGMVGVEAMCSGIPVVAHPADGLLESLGPAGIFVDRDDLAGWRREIDRLSDPDEWSFASTAALARAAELAAAQDPAIFCDAVESLA